MSRAVVRDREGYEIRTHGEGGYYRGCRCDTCRAGAKDRSRRLRAQGRAARLAAEAAGVKYYVAPVARHGISAYMYAGCRCLTCRLASSRSAERRSARAREAS